MEEVYGSASVVLREQSTQSDASAESGEGTSPASCDGASQDQESNELFTIVPDAKELGRLGEDIAAQYLEHRDYEVIERNWTCPYGEADIIARCPDGGGVALVEVKTRFSRLGSNDTFPELAVNDDKLARYKLISMQYLATHPQEHLIRFDVIAINLSGPRRGHLRHICNAYQWYE